MAKTIKKTTRQSASAKALKKTIREPGVVKSTSKTYTFEEFARILYGNQEGKVTRPYEQSVWVNRCISKLASEISMLDFVLSGNSDNIIENGELYELVQNPNSEMTASEFFEESISFLMLCGEVFWINLDRNDLVWKQVGVVGTPQMTEFAPRGKLVGWIYVDDEGISHQLTLADVIQIKFWNPYNKFRGLAPIIASKLAISQDYKASLFNDSMLSNGAEPGGALYTEQDLTDEQCQQIYQSFTARHQGPGKAKDLAILKGGLKYQAIASTMMDMQFQDLKKMNPEEICIALQTPPPVIGLVNDVKYANQGECLKLYFQSAILPLATKLGRIFTSKILQRYGKYWGWFNTDSHPTAIAMIMERMETATKMCALGATLNDVNKRLGLGLPEYPWGNTWYKPMGLSDVKEPINLGPELKEGEEPSAISSQPSAEENNQDEEEEMQTSIVQKSLEVIKTTVWERWASSIRPIEKRMADALDKYFYRQRREILQRLEAVEKGIKTSTIQKDINQNDVVKVLFDVSEENGKLKAIIQPFIGDAVAFGASQSANEIGVEKIFGVHDPLSIKAMQQRWPKLQKVNTYTNAMVKNVVEKGITEGKTVAQIAQDIRKNPVFSGTRAMNIARTETAGAVSQGRFDGFKELGVPKKGWLSARSGSVRKTHQHADVVYMQNPIPMNEPFIVGNSRLMHPGDPAGTPEEVINCRCCILPVVGNKSLQKTIEEYAIVKFLSYNDFVQKSINGGFKGNNND